jgi:hypothetical protein
MVSIFPGKDKNLDQLGRHLGQLDSRLGQLGNRHESDKRWELADRLEDGDGKHLDRMVDELATVLTGSAMGEEFH